MAPQRAHSLSLSGSLSRRLSAVRCADCTARARRPPPRLHGWMQAASAPQQASSSRATEALCTGLIGEIRASPASLPGPRALQTCFRSARTDTHTRQHSELSLRPLRPLRPLPPSAASTALPPLPPLPLCRSQERLELCSAAVSLCRSGSAPLHCCCVHARTHTHARIASSLSQRLSPQTATFGPPAKRPTKYSHEGCEDRDRVNHLWKKKKRTQQGHPARNYRPIRPAQFAQGLERRSGAPRRA